MGHNSTTHCTAFFLFVLFVSLLKFRSMKEKETLRKSNYFIFYEEL